MARGKQNFRQGDLTKALKALEAAGKRIARVEVENGKLIVVVKENGEDAGKVNPWDEVFSEHRNQK